MKIIPNFIKNIFTNNTTETYSCNYINGLTVNAESNSTTNTYSCDYINDCNTYSTSETFTGKYWIDGKKIYRKTKTVNNSSNGEAVAVDMGLSNIDNIWVDYSHSYLDTNSNLRYYGIGNDGNSGYWFNVRYIDSDKTTVRCMVGGGISGSSKITITVEYTKTS